MSMPSIPEVNQKENFMRFLEHKKTELIPTYMAANATVGATAFPEPWFECGPVGGGLDGFGVEWEAPSSGGGAAIPTPNKFILKDITEWREVIKFPSVSEYNWEEKSAMDMANVDRDKVAVDYCVGHGVFDRLTFLMGFEEALYSLAAEPEAVNELFTAITDYKIEHLDYVAKYYHPDTVTYADDMATERALFMSVDTYRKLIKPHQKRFCDACRERGILPILHCCGYAADIVEDMIDCGFVAWTSVQPTNDICHLIETYGDRIGFIGGYDTNGKPGWANATDEEVVAEIHRCYDEYGKYGYGFSFWGFRIFNTLDMSIIGKAMGAMIQESMKYSMQLYVQKLMQLESGNNSH